ncbi:MAG TPA: hypothetical protein VFF49_05540 [Thermodesulfobacteriota bacterium]|nr:hypothetical protein [Thermodesulfobacteriota bacterium]
MTREEYFKLLEEIIVNAKIHIIRVIITKEILVGLAIYTKFIYYESKILLSVGDFRRMRNLDSRVSQKPKYRFVTPSIITHLEIPSEDSTHELGKLYPSIHE